IAARLLVLINGLRLLLLHDLALDFAFAQRHGHLGEARALRQRKAVDGFEVLFVGVVEGLRDLRAREAVVQNDLQVMIANLDGLVGRSLRGQCARGVARGGGGETETQREAEADSASESGEKASQRTYEGAVTHAVKRHNLCRCMYFHGARSSPDR